MTCFFPPPVSKCCLNLLKCCSVLRYHVQLLHFHLHFSCGFTECCPVSSYEGICTINLRRKRQFSRFGFWLAVGCALIGWDLQTQQHHEMKHGNKRSHNGCKQIKSLFLLKVDCMHGENKNKTTTASKACPTFDHVSCVSSFKCFLSSVDWFTMTSA